MCDANVSKSLSIFWMFIYNETTFFFSNKNVRIRYKKNKYAAKENDHMLSDIIWTYYYMWELSLSGVGKLDSKMMPPT